MSEHTNELNEHVTADELGYLETLGEQERTVLAGLRAARQSYEAHLARRYKLQPGDTIDNATGAIVRAKKV